MTTDNQIISSIVLAEDDADDREFFSDVIKQINPQTKIEFVTNGIRLLELLENFCPDILFLDLEMPYKNGLECLVAIRDNPLIENLPVVVFSSSSKPSNIQTAYEMGAHLFLIKSSRFSEYLSSVKAILDLNWKFPDAIREQYCVNNRYTAFN